MTAPHFDDEQLSAHLDGMDDDEGAAHVRSCGGCESRLARLRAVRSLVQAPPARPPEPVMEAAVAAARAAWVEERGDRRGPAEVVAGHRAGRVPKWVLPVAAALTAVMLAIPVLASRDGGDDRAETAATGDHTMNARSDEVPDTDGGDLGEQSDPAALGRAIRGSLPGSASDEALADAPLSGGARLEEGPPVAGLESPAPQPAEAGSDRDTAGTAKRAAPAATPPCARRARTEYGQGLGDLAYAALARWQGTPAVVLAYRLADTGAPGLDYRVLVMALQDCRLLVVQSL